MGNHAAFCRPSAAHRWLRCPGSVAIEVGYAEETSFYSAEGIVAHIVAAEMLTHPEREQKPRIINIDKFSINVDQNMIGYVSAYVEQILNRINNFYLLGAIDVKMFIEVKVDFSIFVGIKNQFGTSDVILIIEWPSGEYQIDVNDLKYGAGQIVNASDAEEIEEQEGDAEIPEDVYESLDEEVSGNEQMMMYALGAVDNFSWYGEFTKISMAIHQPRRDHFDEWECSLETLLNFADHAKRSAIETVKAYRLAAIDHGVFQRVYLNPGRVQCRSCTAKPHCKALANKCVSLIANGPEDLLDTDLEALVIKASETIQSDGIKRIEAVLPYVDMIKNWCNSLPVRARIEMEDGKKINGYKLVMSRRGLRRWSEPQEVEAKFKLMGLAENEMYNMKLISPPTAEKLLASTSPKRWKALQAFITRGASFPKVVPIADKRTAIVSTSMNDMFEDLTKKGSK